MIQAICWDELLIKRGILENVVRKRESKVFQEKNLRGVAHVHLVIELVLVCARGGGGGWVRERETE